MRLARLKKPTGHNARAMRDVLGYFVRHPRAADTLDGIVRFRLLEELLQRSLDETEAALEQLVAGGLLRREATPGPRVLYRLAHERRDEALRTLRALTPSASGREG